MTRSQGWIRPAASGTRADAVTFRPTREGGVELTTHGHPCAPIVPITGQAWREFIAAAAAGEFNDLEAGP